MYTVIDAKNNAVQRSPSVIAAMRVIEKWLRDDPELTTHNIVVVSGDNLTVQVVSTGFRTLLGGDYDHD